MKHGGDALESFLDQKHGVVATCGFGADSAKHRIHAYSNVLFGKKVFGSKGGSHSEFDISTG